MRLYKPRYTQPVPPDAKVKGGYATITDKGGFQKRCKVFDTPAGKRMTVESSHYFLVFRDHTDTERRLRTFREKADAEALQRIVASLIYHRQKGKPLTADLHRQVDGLDTSIHDALAGWGLVPRRSIVRLSNGLEDLLKSYEDYLTVQNGDKPAYVLHTLRQLRVVFTGCKWQTTDDIAKQSLRAWLTEQRKSGEGYCGETGWSVRTTNSHLGAVKSFVRWAVGEAEVMSADPIGTMKRFKGKKADIRRVRRVLTAREIITLLRKTRQGPIRYGMDGQERALLYAFAVQTGLRVNETRQLKVNDFDFERSGGPVVKVRAAYAKTDEAAEQPLQPRLARKVKRFIQDRRKVGGAKVFGGSFQRLTVFTARILREDIEAAGLEYKTADGYADFHSLRHVFTTSIRNVDDTVKMGLTRHATREMLDTYDHGDEDLALKRAALSQVKHWGRTG